MKYDDLRRLAEAATPGPWRARQDELQRGWSKADGHDWRYVSFSTKRDASYTTSVLEGPDARYIAAVSPDVILALLDERERLQRAAIGAEAYIGFVERYQEPGTLLRELRSLLIDKPVETAP